MMKKYLNKNEQKETEEHTFEVSPDVSIEPDEDRLFSRYET